MFSYNRIELIGYQTQTLFPRQTPQGTSVVDLNLIVPSSFKTESGEILEGKSFHVVTVWGAMADIAAQFIRPGTHLFVSGRLQTDSWEDEKSHEKKYKTKVVALDLIILDPKDGQLPSPQGARNLCGALNRASIVGNLTRDPEIRTTTSGRKVLTVGVATNDRWKDKSGQTQERAEFHNVVVWGELAEEVVNFCKKGSRVYATGRVLTRSWDTPQGQKRTTTELVADQFLLLGIHSATAMDAVEASASRGAASARPAASLASGVASDLPPKDSGEGLPEVPAIEYASEIRAEDLPF